MHLYHNFVLGHRYKYVKFKVINIEGN